MARPIHTNAIHHPRPTRRAHEGLSPGALLLITFAGSLAAGFFAALMGWTP